MVLVDTSIWISLYRRKDAEIGQLIWALTARNEAAITGQIWVEFLGGFRIAQLVLDTRKSFARIRSSRPEEQRMTSLPSCSQITQALYR